MIDKNTKLLIVSPHPDDETLGCAGLICKVKKAGGQVFVMIMTYGDEPQYGGVSEKSSRQQELDEAMNYLGVDDWEVLFIGEEYHLRLDSLPEKTILDAIEKKARLSLNNLHPNLVGIPSPSSFNVDHRVTWQCSFTALRPRPHHLKSYCPIVFTYDHLCLWNSKPFEANWFLDISEEIDTKIHALSLYKTQIRQDPHERSLENIRNFHSVQGKAQGVQFIEAHQINRFYLK